MLATIRSVSISLVLLSTPTRAQPPANEVAKAILERAARSNADARKGSEISESKKNQCVVAADAAAARFIRDGRLDVEAWLAVASEKKKLEAISCITREREREKALTPADFQRCRPTLERIAAGMRNEQAMALAMRVGCERYIIP
jgi:hypothetical protein